MTCRPVSDLPPDPTIGYLTRCVHQLVQAALRPVFAADGLTNMQWHALVSIHCGRGATAAALSRDVAYDKGAMTRLLDVLEARGWVVRERACDDRRAVRLALTAEGAALAERMRLKLVATWNNWLADSPDEEVASALATLQRL